MNNSEADQRPNVQPMPFGWPFHTTTVSNHEREAQTGNSNIRQIENPEEIENEEEEEGNEEAREINR